MNKILVIDDNETMQTILKFKLVKKNYHLKTALDGNLGKQLIYEFKPDLIVTDLIMLVVSRLIKYLRLDLSLDTPIVMLSPAGEEKIVLQAFELGENDYEKKPFRPNELVKRIKIILERSYS